MRYALPILKDKKVKEADEDLLADMIRQVSEKSENRGKDGEALKDNTLKLDILYIRF